ncbi:MAG: hypothetical protein LW703_08405 [Rhodobacter sp.]|nr:hypothetical protein [Rhodobacter sp.]
MQIEGYTPVGERHETDELHMWVSQTVVDFLQAERRGANKQHVDKVVLTLGILRRNGFRDLSNSTLFVYEGRFPAGRPGMADMAVYAAKSSQLRVYGGIVRIKGQSVFLCPEGAVKQQNKADQAQLKRVAKILGEYHER